MLRVSSDYVATISILRVSFFSYWSPARPVTCSELRYFPGRLISSGLCPVSSTLPSVGPGLSIPSASRLKLLQYRDQLKSHCHDCASHAVIEGDGYVAPASRYPLYTIRATRDALQGTDCQRRLTDEVRFPWQRSRRTHVGPRSPIWRGGSLVLGQQRHLHQIWPRSRRDPCRRDLDRLHSGFRRSRSLISVQR